MSPRSGPRIDREELRPRALGGPVATARLRASPADFRVFEIPQVQPDGEGEHWLVEVEKRQCTTPQLAEALARAAGVSGRDVGYAGLKDRDAVTRQWFSVPATGPAPDQWTLPEGRVLDFGRHRRKLRRGTLKGNRFQIVLRDLTGSGAAVDRLLARIATQGVPNYFGPQRFGRDGSNVEQLLQGRLPRRGTRRGMLLSAGRAWIFNRVLAERVCAANWDQPIGGDVMMLEGSRSWFAAEPEDPELSDRCRRGDIHPSGPLWGRGELPGAPPAAALEQRIVEEERPVAERLEQAGLEQDRRALRMPVSGLEWVWRGDALELDFRLPPGGFATAVIREVVDTEPAESATRQTQTTVEESEQ